MAMIPFDSYLLLVALGIDDDQHDRAIRISKSHVRQGAGGRMRVDANGSRTDEFREVAVHIIIKAVFKLQRVTVQDDAGRRAIVRAGIGLGLMVDNRYPGVVASGPISKE